MTDEDDIKAGIEEQIKYFMEHDDISREEAIRVVRRVRLLAYVATLDVKDRAEALQAIEEVGGL
jgi:hypothetical protein